jgi:hypothetical protein
VNLAAAATKLPLAECQGMIENHEAAIESGQMRTLGMVAFGLGFGMLINWLRSTAWYQNQKLRITEREMAR